MHFVVVYYPTFDWNTEEKIRTFRGKYDPFACCLRPHITFIFPVACSEVEEAKLAEHVEKVSRNWKPFPIRIGGFRKSWDHWLLLLLKKGNEEALALHDELYSGILSPYLRKDIKYVPHISIGLFVRKGAEYDALDPKKADFDAKLYSQALGEAKSLKIDSVDTVDRLFLEKVIIKTGALKLRNTPLDNDLVEIVSSKEIKLQCA